MGLKRAPVLAALPDRWYGVAFRNDAGKLVRARGCCVRANARSAVIRFGCDDWPFPKEIEVPLSMLYHAPRPKPQHDDAPADLRVEREQLAARLQARRARNRRRPVQLLP